MEKRYLAFLLPTHRRKQQNHGGSIRVRRSSSPTSSTSSVYATCTPSSPPAKKLHLENRNAAAIVRRSSPTLSTRSVYATCTPSSAAVVERRHRKQPVFVMTRNIDVNKIERRKQENHNASISVRRSSPTSSIRSVYATCIPASASVVKRRHKQPIFVMTRNMDMKKIERLYDCFILDFNPYERTSSRVSKSHHYSGKSSDLWITAEKGKVALRDYPHPRHLCTRYAFNKTQHHAHCRLCYCYVCDVAAPCKRWGYHCYATDRDPYWKSLRHICCSKRRMVRA